MVQLEILSGKQAGSSYQARRFPVRIGRSPQAHLRFEEAGVWEDHLQLSFLRRKGFLLQRHGDAFATVNGQPVEEQLLRSGDLIELGSVKLRFWLAERQQRGLSAREFLIWMGIALVTLVQFFIIYRLLGA